MCMLAGIVVMPKHDCVLHAVCFGNVHYTALLVVLAWIPCFVCMYGLVLVFMHDSLSFTASRTYTCQAHAITSACIQSLTPKASLK